jgi:release factor glutamine methyltransferase
VTRPVLRIADALRQAREAGVERLDAQWLLGHHLGRDRAWLLAHDDEPLPAALASAWPTLLARRATGEPLAYIVGEREFCGLRLAVSPAVLVPRPETEDLVRWALDCIDADTALAAGPLLDLGTGSGAIALALKHARPALAVHASDASPDALAVARGNAQRLGLAVQFHHGPWWQPVPAGPWAVVVSNPPYVAPGDPHLATLKHEPLQALVPAAADARGLTDLHTLIDGTLARLRPGGWLLLEHGHDQAEAVRERLQGAGFCDVATRADLAGMPRCSAGRRPLAHTFQLS